MRGIFMKKIFKVTGKVLLILLAVIAAFLLVMFVCNQIMLKKEAVIFENPPVGQLVEVDAHNMCIYTEGATIAVYVSEQLSAARIMGRFFDPVCKCSLQSQNRPRILPFNSFSYLFYCSLSMLGNLPISSSCFYLFL